MTEAILSTSLPRRHAGQLARAVLRGGGERQQVGTWRIGLLETRTGQDHLLPVMMVREVLSRHLAGSESGSTFKEGDINAGHFFLTSTLGDPLHHHFTDKRDRNTADAMHHLIRTGNISIIEVRALGISGL